MTDTEKILKQLAAIGSGQQRLQQEIRENRRLIRGLIRELAKV